MRPAEALAEAHFRQGIKKFYGPPAAVEAGLNDLRQAAAYQPGDPVYAYHLGLASHHTGLLDQAVQAYQVARQRPGNTASRAAYPLALALAQQGQDPEADASLWLALSTEEQTTLRHLHAFRRRPYRLPPDTPRLWQILASLDTDEPLVTQKKLQETLDVTRADPTQGVIHYYLGVLAARVEDWETVRHEWSAADAAGFSSPRLQSNLVELFQRTAEENLAAGDMPTALAAGLEAARHKPDDPSLSALLAQIYQQLGYQAASANRWDEAEKHWQTAVDLDRSSFRLAYNLALAYEHSENYQAAAITWREVLRRRPRRADHPDALNDEQIVRLLRHTAENLWQSRARVRGL